MCCARWDNAIARPSTTELLINNGQMMVQSRPITKSRRSSKSEKQVILGHTQHCYVVKTSQVKAILYDLARQGDVQVIRLPDVPRPRWCIGLDNR